MPDFSRISIDGNNYIVKDAAARTSIQQEIETRANADALLNGRIDQIISPSGSAPSAAEITDARVGADGVTYNLLGNALRTQFGNLYDLYKPTENLYDKDTLIDGSISSNGGLNTSNTNYRTSDYIPIDENYTYHFNANTAVYAFYNSSKTFISPYGYWSAVSGGQDLTPPSNAAYVRVSYNVNHDDPKSLSLYAVTNLLNDVTFTTGSISSNGGLNTSNTNYRTSDYIPIDENYTYHFNANTAVYAFYNSSKTFISPYGYWSAVSGGQDLTPPSNAAYVRVSYNVNQDILENLELYNLSLRSTPYEFVPKGIYIPSLVLKESQLLHSFKEYRPGQIHFTIPVNSFVFKHGISASTYSDNELINYVPSVLRLPKTYTHVGKPTPLVILCHGAGFGVSDVEWGSGNTSSDSSNFNVLINKFIDSGYAVCDTNGYNNSFAQQTWGCQRAVQGYRKLYEYIRANYNIENEIYIYGFSMGGLMALNLATKCTDIVKCMGLGAPVTHLWGQCWTSAYGVSKNWRYASALAFDFEGISDVTWSTTDTTPNESEQSCWDTNKALTYGFDPMEATITINTKVYNLKRFPPIRIWQGTSDDAIGLDYTNAFANSVNNSGGVCSVRAVSGGSHGISYGSNTYVNEEIIRWFNRFRI